MTHPTAWQVERNEEAAEALTQQMAVGPEKGMGQTGWPSPPRGTNSQPGSWEASPVPHDNDSDSLPASKIKRLFWGPLGLAAALFLTSPHLVPPSFPTPMWILVFQNQHSALGMAASQEVFPTGLWPWLVAQLTAWPLCSTLAACGERGLSENQFCPCL